MRSLKIILGQGVLAYTACLLCEGIDEYIPYPAGKICILMNYERKNYERNREEN